MLLEGAQLEATHLAVQQRARKLLRRYRELRALVAARGAALLAPDDTPVFRRGERLEAFLTQPFYVAEASHPERPGAWVPLADTLADVRRLLDGAADETPADALRWLGPLSGAVTA